MKKPLVISFYFFIISLLLIFCRKSGDEIGVLIEGADTASFEGYMDKISYIPGDNALVYLHSKVAKKDTFVSLYSVSGQKVAEVTCDLKSQLISGKEPWKDGFRFDVTFKYTIPNIKSGVYLWNMKIPFIIKNPNKNSQIVILYASNTENAYNTAGGESLYKIDSTTNKYFPIMSFLRPHLFAQFCLPFFIWIENQQLDVSYIDDLDMEDFSEFENAKLLIITGHSEYWTRNARQNFDKYINRGKNAAVLAGNTMWWQVRYNSNTTQLICYKSASADPIRNPLLKTINWVQSSLNYPIYKSIGADFNHGGYGMRYKDNGWNGYKIVVTNSPILKDARLQNEEILSVPTDEYDGAPISGFDNNKIPVLDNKILNFHKVELIGYDLGIKDGKETVPTFIAFQKTPTSGIIINTASTDWCNFKGADSDKIKIITSNIIYLLLNNENIFIQ